MTEKGKKVLRTLLCDLLGIEYPIMLAGMAAAQGDPLLTASGAEVTAVVSNAGGFGMIGGARFLPEELRKEIKKTRELTDKPFGVDLLLPTMVDVAGSAAESKAGLPKEYVDFVNRLSEEIGVPLVKLERPVLTQKQIIQQVNVIFEENVPVIASGLGNPGWIVPRAHEQGVKVIALVGNVKNALRVAESGVDIIVAQGYEGGGHTGRIGTLALIPQVVDAVRPIPVVAAGGIGDGRGLVAALALGAVGVWCGTIFLATSEATRPDYHKRMLVEAIEEDARITTVYTGKTLRHLNNKLIQTWEKAGMSTLPYPLQGLLISELLEGLRRAGKEDYLSGYSGQIVGLIKEVKPARQIVEEMVEEAIRILTETFPTEVSLG